MTQFATAKSADGVFGHIIYAGDGKFYFRVYNYDTGENTFIDYLINHSDLYVQIKDPDAFFYSTSSGIYLLDHSPETLGKQ
jgi:hypothetical protein